MPRKTVADLVIIRNMFAARRRTAAYRATEGFHESHVAEMVAAHHAVVAIEAVIAEGGDGMDVDGFWDTAMPSPPPYR